MDYQFHKTPAPPSIPLPEPTAVVEIVKPQVQLTLIDGKRPSTNEWNVSRALDQLGVRYQYQVAINGNIALRGAIIADFVVYAPFPFCLEVLGDWWHGQAIGFLTDADKFKLSVETHIFNRQAKYVWGHETETEDDALNAVRRELNQ